jgi:hypothetical protein
MAITHIVGTRNSLADQIDADIGAAGVLRLLDDTVTLLDIAFSNPAFGAAASGVITVTGTPSGSVATGGTVDKFEFRSSGGAIVFGSVTAVSGGGDLEITNTVLVASDTVTVTSLTYTAAP